MTKILVTGAAGFIGFHLVKKLLSNDFDVIGLDNINDYYNVNLKYSRLAETGIYSIKEDRFEGGENRTYSSIEFNSIIQSNKYKNYRFIRLDLESKGEINNLFENEEFDYVVNLAAQAGVRYSIENPDIYIQSNVVGFLNILEACRFSNVKHLVYASSSSVYGLNEDIPFSTLDNVDHPVSLYAATKKSNELMAHTYSHLYKVPTTGLRFFTVYGPWGRPDMALFLFTKAIFEGKSIKVFNNGNLERDFTFIDDIIEGIFQVLNKPPKPNSFWDGMNPDPSSSKSPFKIYNIGNSSPVKLLDFINAIERETGLMANKKFLPMQSGDVYKTWADCSGLKDSFNYKPNTTVNKGVSKFVKWFKIYYNIK